MIYVSVAEEAAVEVMHGDEGNPMNRAQGYGEFSFIVSGGRPSQSRLRTTLVVVQQRGEWKIRQHHFSTTPEVPPIWRSRTIAPLRELRSRTGDA